MIQAECLEKGRKWRVVRDGDVLGAVERLQSGFMLTLSLDGSKIKRFRMIDALRQAFGDEEEIRIDQPPPSGGL